MAFHSSLKLLALAIILLACRQTPVAAGLLRQQGTGSDSPSASLPAELAGDPDDPPGDEEADSGSQAEGEAALVRLTREQKSALAAAFAEVHDGWSADEVLLRDDLQAAFLAAARRRIPELTSAQCNWGLINLRKAGLLGDVRATRRDQTDVAPLRAVAEIAARQVSDRHGASTDQIMADPALRAEFDSAVRAVDAEADLYSARKAAFQLRKARQLRPELITRIADWGRRVVARPAAEWREDPVSIPEQPGIYIFSDSTGYLYIGESDNLRRRLEGHLQDSDRKSLAAYLAAQGCDNIIIEIHTFEPGSRIGELAVRRAYESELIRSRNPRFNIRP